MSLENPNLTPEAPSVSSMEADVADIFGLAAPEPVVPPAGEDPSPAAGPGAGGEQAPSPAPEPSPGAPAPTPAPAAPGEPPAPSPTPADPAAPAPNAAPPSPVDENALKLHSLEATVEALQAELTAVRASPAPAAPAAPAGPETGTPAADIPAYRLSLPQQVAEAIFDEENPERRVAGITHMMNSLAAIVHHNCRLEFNGRLQALVDQARSQEASTQTAEQVETGREQYYAAFPTHKSELVLPLIQDESRRMAAEFPNLKWDANYVAALGTRVNNRIAALTGQPPTAVVPVPAAPAPGLPVGTREPVASGQSEGDLIADTFSS